MMIRLMKTEDYDGVLALWHACTGMGLNNLDDSRQGIERFLKRNPETCFVSEDAGRINGVILAGSDGRRGYIYHTAVHPDCRHRGIASALADTVIEALRNLGIHKTALVVFERNEAGNAFWEKKGFHRRTDLVYRDFIIYEMVRYDT